jgi:hypothetical protein
VPRESFAKFPMPRNSGVRADLRRHVGVVRSDDITQDALRPRSAPHHGMPGAPAGAQLSGGAGHVDRETSSAACSLAIIARCVSLRAGAARGQHRRAGGHPSTIARLYAEQAGAGRAAHFNQRARGRVTERTEQLREKSEQQFRLLVEG